MSHDDEPRVASISDVIADRIRAVRAAQGVGRDELAAAARAAGAPATMTAAAIGNIETGRRDSQGRRRREVSVDELVWLATALHCSPRELLGENAPLFAGDPDRGRSYGDVESATRAALEQLGELVGQEVALAASVLTLAQALDDGAGMATAAVSKELRATLKAIWDARTTDPGDDDDDFGPE